MFELWGLSLAIAIVDEDVVCYYGCCCSSTWNFFTMNITIIAIIKHAKVSTMNNTATVVVAPSKYGVESTMISLIASTIMEKIEQC